MKILPIPLIIGTVISIIFTFSIIPSTHYYLTDTNYKTALIRVDSIYYRSTGSNKRSPHYYSKIENKIYELHYFSEDNIYFTQLYDSQKTFKVAYYTSHNEATYYKNNFRYYELKYILLSYFYVTIPILLFLLLRYSYRQLKAYAPYGLGDNNEPLTKEQSDEKFKD